MHSSKSDKHTQNLNCLAQAVGKPITQVAEDLIAFAFKELGIIYKDLDKQEISKIPQSSDYKNSNQKTKRDEQASSS